MPPPPKQPEVPDNSWMDTFGDMVTLLLCFFILLASISKIDAVVFEQVQAGMTKEIAKQPPVRPIESLKNEITADIVTAKAEQAVDVGTDERGVVLNLDSGAFFRPGSAEIRPEAHPILKEMAETFANKRFDSYFIEVQGHTDDTPVKTQAFASNWELASARAVATLRMLASLGVKEDRMSVAAFAQHRPRVPNRLQDGTPLPDNQALNRRVAVHIFPR